MLLTKDLIKDIEEKYVPMLETVNIPDFTKCIAEFSGLSLNEISNEMIKDYLQTWAKNKFKFFELLGNKTKYDTKVNYRKIRNNINKEVISLAKNYPIYAAWLMMFSDQVSNKIESRNMHYRDKDTIEKIFGMQYKLDGSTLTHFFKSKINAPDELITELAHIFECDMVEANYTISIDPVDIMTASENPYDWQSCYRLETFNSESHADGCMAALLDTSSLITYIWKNEGQLSLYGRYELKNIRYKMMREWIALSEEMTTVHFSDIYPGKNYEVDFYKTLRIAVETMISESLEIENKWKKTQGVEINRENFYGWGEFNRDNMYVQSDSDEETITVYDTQYKCACGCGQLILESNDACGDDYSGEGFHHDCMEERYWCEEAADWCEACGENCDECQYHIENNPVCGLNDTIECSYIPDNYWSDRTGVVEACDHNCSSCMHWLEHNDKELNE